MRSGVIRISVNPLRPWRMISWPAACGMRWVKPSSATVSPSRTADWMASAREEIRAIRNDSGWGAVFTAANRQGQMAIASEVGASNGSRGHAGQRADFHHSRRTRGHHQSGPHALWRTAHDRHYRRHGSWPKARRPDFARWRRLADHPQRWGCRYQGALHHRDRGWRPGHGQQRRPAARTARQSWKNWRGARMSIPVIIISAP